MKKRILFILHLPPPVHGSSVVGEYIYNSKEINNFYNTRFINLGLSKSVLEIGENPFRKISRYINLIYNTIYDIIDFKPELVYISLTAKGIGFYKDFLIIVIAKLFRKKVVLHFHNKGVLSNQNNYIDNLLYKFTFYKSKVILLSERLYYDVKKYVNLEDVLYCPNGIPVHTLSSKISNVNKVTQLLFLSNLIETKGVFVLLESLKHLKEQGIKFQCNIVGGEGDISSIVLEKKLVNLNLIDCVSYLGKKYNDDKYEIFQSSDIFVFPTFYENETFGLVNIEAMMFGLPVISTSEGGIPDIVQDGETGFIVDKQNPKKLAEKIKYLIENPDNAILMGKKGQEMFFKHYTLEVFEARLIHILNQIK
ncbi:glycosyltransferase family 4 protein [Polaribacter sp.]|nr:glycosyltransferase family 4 protein [Polaribacter sp.]